MTDTKNENNLRIELEDAKIEKSKNEWSCYCSKRTTDKDFMMFLASTIILI